MRRLQLSEIKHISGAGVLRGLGTCCASLAGASIGIVVGATLLTPTIELIRISEETYLNSLKSQVTNYVISYKYGHLGINSKTDAMGALGGAFVGSVLGASLFALVS